MLDELTAALRWSLYEGFVNAKFFEEQRLEMVAAIRAIAEHMAPEIGKTALGDRVLRAMAKVPRHEFVPIEVQQYAYLNRPIPIGFDKTISQPFMVAVMKGPERQGQNEGNYAGIVLGARGIRPTCIPGVLIKMSAESRWRSGFRIN